MASGDTNACGLLFFWTHSQVAYKFRRQYDIEALHDSHLLQALMEAAEYRRKCAASVIACPKGFTKGREETFAYYRPSRVRSSYTFTSFVLN